MRTAIVSAGFRLHAARLQPHRTLLEMGRQLVALGHSVTLLSDGVGRRPRQETLFGLPVSRVRSTHLFRIRRNEPLMAEIERASPDLLLWHLGLPSFAHQEFRGRFSAPVFGILTSPIHQLRDVLRLGTAALASDPVLVASQLAGLLVPGAWIRRSLGSKGLRGIITLSETTRRYLLHHRVPANRVWTVAPGADADWLRVEQSAADRCAIRRSCGFGDRDLVVTYFGSPAPVRGIRTLLEGAALTVPHCPRLKLLILSRRDRGRNRQASRLASWIRMHGLEERAFVVEGILERSDLIRHVLCGDAVCLPFSLVPSDVPLGILEAMASGRTLITTRVASIPELAEADRAFLVPPRSPHSLAQVLRMLGERPDIGRRRALLARVYARSHRSHAAMGVALQRALQATTGTLAGETHRSESDPAALPVSAPGARFSHPHPEARGGAK